MKTTLTSLLLAALLAAASLTASVPAQIHYQGRLTDSSGDPVNATVAMTVRMYDSPTGGTLLYEEAIGGVVVADGVYSFSFGAAGTRTTSGSEVVLTTNGVNQIFNGTIQGAVINGTLALSDGVYSWSQAGGSSSPDFSVSYTHSTKAVQVIYTAGVPPAGRDLVATYDYIDTSEIFATLTAAEHWLALVVDGAESTPRSRLLAVPYAMKARESADAPTLAAQISALQSQVSYLLELTTPAGFVYVPGGTLAMSMGTVTVATFYIGKHEVTWGEWQEVRTYAAANGYDIGSRGSGCADDHPVHTVAWFDVVKWCNAKSEMEGLTPVYSYDGSVYKTGEPTHTLIQQNLSTNGYRLPLEAEWEFAARGGNQTNGYTYSGSNDLDTVGWYWDNSGGAECDLSSGHGTWPVGQKAANELGLHDMSGNVWEWCWDQSGSSRHFRGGGWFSIANDCAVSIRYSLIPGNRGNSRGFRLARSLGN